jgi:hypothetical protein
MESLQGLLARLNSVQKNIAEAEARPGSKYDLSDHETRLDDIEGRLRSLGQKLAEAPGVGPAEAK